ncbi:Aldo/keto reductase [Anaerovibrio sp. JC8]|uniref:aldo/keto reductase n=1 Tax=Anaerovibrio sp. JC8 TaxID=1240085 RepID=UPI000A0AF2FA|nr:aldo/keto reductase [Anaerovibrio sp. JC8]ORT99964.1 Aldo/keto reductase [Anaerovibrio sp. JC8]
MNKQVTLKNGSILPPIGLGTWMIGDEPAKEKQEIEAILTGLRSGMGLIDTAEMYGDGRSEILVGKALDQYFKEGKREDVFVVSKVLPWNAGRKDMRNSCVKSLERLGLDYLDMYLYHWIGNVPMEEVVEGLNALQDEGLIRSWGVSNFDTKDMEKLLKIPGGEKCQVNQVLYHLGSRGIEFNLIDYMNGHGIVLMSYCPLAQGGRLSRGLRENPVVCDIAKAHGVTPSQVLLAWNIRNGHTIAIPKSSSATHIKENVQSAELELTAAELKALDGEYPPPAFKVPLDTE